MKQNPEIGSNTYENNKVIKAQGDNLNSAEITGQPFGKKLTWISISLQCKNKYKMTQRFKQAHTQTE